MAPHRSLVPGSQMMALIATTTLLTLAATAVRAEDVAKQAPVPRDLSQTATGSGKAYLTTVERQTVGELSPQDLHQASLLASRVVKHVNQAVKVLIDQNPAAARTELDNARKLVLVVRALLPITTTTTVVKDASGSEVYRDVDRVQDDRIPLYRGMIATEVVEPILDAQRSEAAVKGLRLADASVVRTTVLADLSYLERKVERALALLDKPAEALAQLVLAQAQGVEAVVNQADTPLVLVQQALRLAERMVDEGKHDAAKENLRLAQVQLETYRAVLEPKSSATVKQLEDDIAALATTLQDKGAARSIRAFWERAVKLFREESGQAHVVEPEVKQERTPSGATGS